MRISPPRLLSASLFGLLLGLLPPTAAAQTSLGSVNIGSSATSTVTVTIPSGGTLSTISVVTQGAPNLDFTDAGGGTCATGTVYAASATCTVNVAFKPKYPGARYGAVVLASSTGILATAYLQGQGLGPQANFLPATQITLPLGPIGNIGASTVVADGNGNLYVVSGSNQLLKETPSSSGYIESVVADATNYFVPTAVDGAGNAYYFFPTPPTSGSIVKASLNAGVYTTSTIYSFNQNPYGYLPYVAVDGSGDVFIIDPNGDLLEEMPSGNTYSQSVILYGLSSISSNPSGITVDGYGNIFILFFYSGNSGKNIMKLSPSSTGYTNSYILPNLSNLYTFSVDGMGNLYIGGYGQVFKETFSNGSYVQSTIAANGATVDGAGNLYYSNRMNIEKVDFADPPSLSFTPTLKGATSTDSSQTVTVSNFGNEPLNISAISYPVDFPEAAADAGDCASGTFLPASESCTLTIDFSPIAALGPTTPNYLSESVSVTTNTLNTTATQQNIAVAGIESVNQPAPAPVFSLPSGNYSSSPFKFNLTDSAQGATINYTLLWISSTGTVTSSPYTYSDQYPAAIDFTGLNAVTVEATATAPGYLTSAVSTVTYTYTDFNVSVTPSSIPGSSGTTTVTITPVNSNGFPFPVTFSCSPTPARGDSCSFSPATVTPGNSAVSTTMTVSPASNSSELHRNSGPLFPGSVLAVTLCCFGWRKRRCLRMLLLITVSIAGLSLINGCGISPCLPCNGNTPPTPVTFTLNVIGTSGSVSHTAYFSYIVNLPSQ